MNALPKSYEIWWPDRGKHADSKYPSQFAVTATLVYEPLIYINSRLIHLNVTLISLGLWQVVTSSWVENSQAPTAPSHADIEACSDGMS